MYPKTVKLTKKVLPHNLMHLPKLVLLMIVILSLVACQPIQAEPAAQTQTTTAEDTPDEEANQAVIQRFYDEVVNQKNMGALEDIFAADLVVHDLDYGANGADLGEMLLTGLPDVQATVSLWVAQDDLVTAVATYSGTHLGEYMGIAPTGNPVTFSIIDIFRIKDGKVIELWHNVPVADQMEQIGAPMQDASAPSTESTQEEANKAIIQRFYEEVVNQKNPAVIGELFDPNIVFHDLDFGADGGNIEEVMTSMPDVETTISLWVVKDDLVTAVVTFNGTHTGGELLSVPATDKPVTFSIIDIWRIKDGKITELWHNVPNSDILEQIQSDVVRDGKITMTSTEEK